LPLQTGHSLAPQYLTRRVNLFESNANSFLVSPCDMAWMLIVIAPNHENKIIWNTERAGDLKTGSAG
jgi:hypothetical protein